MPCEEIPNEILELFDDWGQSIPINVEVLMGEVDLLGVVVSRTMEPLQLEYEGYANMTMLLIFNSTRTYIGGRQKLGESLLTTSYLNRICVN